mgnify:FL=1
MHILPHHSEKYHIIFLLIFCNLFYLLKQFEIGLLNFHIGRQRFLARSCNANLNHGSLLEFSGKNSV